MNLYEAKIREFSPASDPRHVEAYMRLQYGTLDHLDPEEFRVEVALAVTCIVEGGGEAAEKLAISYGL